MGSVAVPAMVYLGCYGFARIIMKRHVPRRQRDEFAREFARAGTLCVNGFVPICKFGFHLLVHREFPNDGLGSELAGLVVVTLLVDVVVTELMHADPSGPVLMWSALMAVGGLGLMAVGSQALSALVGIAAVDFIVRKVLAGGCALGRHLAFQSVPDLTGLIHASRNVTVLVLACMLSYVVWTRQWTPQIGLATSIGGAVYAAEFI